MIGPLLRRGVVCQNKTQVFWTMPFQFTEKQGQYLTFIHNYTKIHCQPPAERDMQIYFRVTPPTVHQMVLKLEEKRLISRMPGQPRTIQVLVPPEELPTLKWSQRMVRWTSTQPGQYSMQIVVYSPARGEELVVQGTGSTLLELGSVIIPEPE